MKIIMSKPNKLIRWCKAMEVFSIDDVKLWATQNYYASDKIGAILARLRGFVHSDPPILERLSRTEIVLLGKWKKGMARVAWYRAI